MTWEDILKEPFRDFKGYIKFDYKGNEIDARFGWNFPTYQSTQSQKEIRISAKGGEVVLDIEEDGVSYGMSLYDTAIKAVEENPYFIDAITYFDHYGEDRHGGIVFREKKMHVRGFGNEDKFRKFANKHNLEFKGRRSNRYQEQRSVNRFLGD
tara:strand:+ start:216 stop:674 length:459 start_codon:yes stop_codon:yes gene_type:complete